MIALPTTALRRGLILTGFFALALVGCGASSSDSATAETGTTATSPAPEPSTATSDHADEDHADEDHADDSHADDEHADDSATSASTSGASTQADVVIEVGFAGGAVTVDQDRVEVTQGQTVGIVLASDVAEAAHVHGYDLSVPVAAGATAEVTFVADTPGVFEVELHESGTFLFEILVR